MDPRHPELAVKRLQELMSQYNQVEHDIRHTTVSSQLGQLERKGGLIVQEICLTAPRLHEAMVQVSRQRRRDLSRGLVEKPVEIASEGVLEVIRAAKQQAETATVEDVNEIPEKVDIEEPDVNEKSKKKTTRKKKTTKKAEK